MRTINFDHPLRAHDVRKLCLCGLCGEPGYSPQMLAVDGQRNHGACVGWVMTREQILALPWTEARKLRLDEIGADLMRELLDRHHKENKDG